MSAAIFPDSGAHLFVIQLPASPTLVYAASRRRGVVGDCVFGVALKPGHCVGACGGYLVAVSQDLVGSELHQLRGDSLPPKRVVDKCVVDGRDAAVGGECDLGNQPAVIVVGVDALIFGYIFHNASCLFTCCENQMFLSHLENVICPLKVAPQGNF